MQKSKFRQTALHTRLQSYEDIKNVPISNSDRRCTDILCIIFGVGLTITLAVFAIVLFNRPNYEREVFAADTDGNTCGFVAPGFNVVYFAKPTELQKNRLCVSQCPKSNKDALHCKKTSTLSCEFGANLQYYDNQYVQNDYGEFCFPKDPKQRQALEGSIKSKHRDLYYNSIYTIRNSLAIVAIASLLYMFLVQCFPRFMNRAVVILGIVALIGVVVSMLIYNKDFTPATKYIVLAIVIIFMIIMICTFAKHYGTWKLNGIFLDFATQFVGQRIYPFVLPVIFLALGVAFYYFQALQYRSFWSFGQLRFDPEIDLFAHIKNPSKNILISIFQIIQILWGTMFLKEAFNYLISSEAVQWYYGKGSNCGNGLFTLVCKHLGSVIACSFMNAFFGVADFICDALIPDFNDTNGCYYCLNRFAGFFDLARSDAMTIVYVSGNAFCNSARYCQYLVKKSKITEQSQSTSRIYRYTSHFAIAGVVCILAFWVLSQQKPVYIPAMGILLLISMGVSTFFISLHADASQAILILYLMESQFILNRTKTESSSRHKEIDYEINKLIQQQERESRPL